MVAGACWYGEDFFLGLKPPTGAGVSPKGFVLLARGFSPAPHEETRLLEQARFSERRVTNELTSISAKGMGP